LNKTTESANILPSSVLTLKGEKSFEF